MSAAYIDMKNCQFFIEDGSSKAGAVNNAAGYAAGASTIAVDGFTGAVITGAFLKFAGHATEYTITAHTETSGNTTSITISPVLTDPVVDNEVITAGPNALEVNIGEGNLTYDEKRVMEYKKNRGKLDQVREGDQEPMDVNFAFAWLYLSSKTGDTVPTVEEALKRKGPASTWKTTGGDCEPYAVHLVIKNSNLTCGAETKPVEKIVLQQFRYESLNHDPKAGTVTSQGKCNVTEALISRLAN
jgi:hypothetical protein